MKTKSLFHIESQKSCLKKQKQPFLIKNLKKIEQGLVIKKSTIQYKKAKTESFFYIKSQGKVLIVNPNKKINHPIKSQDKKFVLYQKLRMVVIGLNKMIYYPTKDQDE